jgi:Arylsulfatase regulator (Fe-S oxidoreductase)
MTSDEIEHYVRRFLAKVGLEPVSVKVDADEPPMDFYPIVDVVVSKKALGEKGVFRAMEDAGDLMSRDQGVEVRAGYYERSPEDVPEGETYDPDHVLLEFDQFAFSLDPASPKP